MRIPFPSKPPDLLKKVQETLRTKAKIKICRLGISAVGFEHRPTNGGIISFLQKGEDKNTITPSKTRVCDDAPKVNAQTNKCSLKSFFNDGPLSQTNLKNTSTQLYPTVNSHELFQKDTPTAKNVTNKLTGKVPRLHAKILNPSPMVPKEQLSVRTDTEVKSLNRKLPDFHGHETDLQLAQELQASFERENYIFKQSSRSKKAKIDHFFKTKKS